MPESDQLLETDGYLYRDGAASQVPSGAFSFFFSVGFNPDPDPDLDPGI
jgi:hypothetical protein